MFGSTAIDNIRKGREEFNDKFTKAELHGLTLAADEIVINSLNEMNRGNDTFKITKYEYGGFQVELDNVKGEFGGQTEADRITYALEVVDNDSKEIDWLSTFDKTLDEDTPMYVPHVHKDVSDANAFAIGQMLATGLTHSGAHMHEGNTLLCQAIAAPNTHKKLNLSTGKVEMLDEPRSYFETSVVTRMLKDYYAFAKEGISGPAYLINSRAKRKSNVKNEDEELKTINVDKGVLPTQSGTVEVNSKDVNVAKKVTSCVIAFSAAACQFEESGFAPKDVVYNYVYPDPDSINHHSELLYTLDDVPLYDFSEHKLEVRELRRKSNRNALENGILLHFDGLGITINGEEVTTIAQKNKVMSEIQVTLIEKRMEKYHVLVNMGNRVLVTDRLLSSDVFEVVQIGLGIDDPIEALNIDFILKGRDTKDYTSKYSIPKQEDWSTDVYDYWDHDGLLEKVMAEVLQYVLSGTPDKQLKKVKSMFSTLMNFIFAKAQSGTGVTYISSLDKRDNTEINGYGTYEIGVHEEGGVYNDEAAYNGMSTSLDGEFNNLEEAGFVHTYKLLKELVSPMRITRWHWRARAFLDSLLAINGYGRTELAMSHKQQIEAELAPDNPPMAKYIHDLARHMMHVAKKEGWIPTEEEFNEVFVSTMKPTSSGVSQGGVAVPAALTYEEPERGMEKRISGLGKILYMIANIEHLKDADNYLSKNHDVWTKENPGRIGSRNVAGAKAARAIFMADMITYRGLYPLATIMDRFQNFVKDESRDYQFYGARNYTVGKETGSPLKDHADAMIASSDPKQFSAMTDFSAFDATEQYPNFWKPFVEGLVQGCEEIGLGEGSDYVLLRSATGGKDLGLVHLIKELLGEKFKNPLYFLSEGSGWEKEALQVAQQAMMPSGLLITLSGNNVCNMADFQVFVDAMREDDQTRCFTIKQMRCMGDDRLVIFDAPIKPDSQQITRIRTLFSEVAEKNGMSMNMDKVTFRNCEFEYLKKRGCYGVVVHKAHVMIHANESVNHREEPIEMVRSYLSTLRVWAWRSGDPVYAEKLGILFARMKLNFRDLGKFSRKSAIRKKFTLYPTLHILYVPGCLGGVGHMHSDMYSSSVDGAIINRMGTDKIFNRHIQLGAKIINDTYSGQIDDHVEAMWRSGQVVDGTGSFDDFKNHLEDVRDDYRYFMAARASEALEAMGVPNVAKRLDYRDMGKKVTESLLETVPQIQDIKYQRLANRGRIIAERMRKMGKVHDKLMKSDRPIKGEPPDVSIPKELNWLTKFRLQANGILKPRHHPSEKGSPFEGNAVVPYIALTKVLDVSTSSSTAAMELKGLINKLYRDRRMRRDISIETISELLLRYVHDSDVMYWALIRMGVLPAYASSAVQEVQNNKAKYVAAASASKMGSYVSDQLLPNLGIDIDLLGRVLPNNTLITPGSPAYSMMLSMVVSRLTTDFLRYGKFLTYNLVKTSNTFDKEYARLLKGIAPNSLAYNISTAELLKNAMSKASGATVIAAIQEDLARVGNHTISSKDLDHERIFPEIVRINRTERDSEYKRSML